MNGKAFSHAVMHVITIRIRGNETNCAEDEGKDQRTKGQQEGCHQVNDVVVSLDFLPHLLVLSRLDVDQTNLLVQTWMSCSRLLEHLVAGVKHQLEEGDGHGEEHPDVDHLEVGSHW